MSFSKKKYPLKNRSLRFESLEQREMLAVAPLPYAYLADSGEYSSNFGTEADFPKPTIDEVTSTSIKLSWDASAFTDLRKSDPFKIERLTKNSKNEDVWVQIGSDIPYSYTIGDGIYTCELKGLTPLTEYKLRVTFNSTKLGTVSTASETVTTDPCEINAEAVSSTEVKLSWSIAGKKDTYFEVYMGVDGATPTNTGEKVKADGSATATKSITIKNLDPAKEYTFYLKYYDTNSVVRETQPIKCTTLHTLGIDETTSESVEIYWNKSLGGSKYQIQICEGKPTSEASWKNVSADPITQAKDGSDTFDYDTYTKYKVSGLKEDKTYYFRLRYESTGNDGEKVTLYTDPLIFSTPTNIKVEDVTDTTAKVKWEFDGKKGMAYFVQIKTGSTWSDYSGANTTLKEYTLKNLDPGTKYEIRVRYTSEDGKTAYSAEQEITTGVPTKLESVTENSATISWDIPNKKPGTTVSIQRCDGSLNPGVESNWRTIKIGIADGTNEDTINHLGSDKEYFFRVVYTDVNNKEQHTLYVSAQTCGVVDVEEFTNDSVTLSWNFTPKDLNYKVQMAPGESPDVWGTIPSGQVKVVKKLDGCEITGLTPGKQYYFRIVYTPKDGSTELTSASTKDVWSDSANLIVSEKTETSLTVRWAPSGFAGGVKNKDFIIYYYEDSDRPNSGGWKTMTVDASKNSATISNLIADTKYQIKVAYVGTAVESAESGPIVEAKTEANEVFITKVTKNTAELKWDFKTYEHSPVSTNPNGDGKGKFDIEIYTGTNFPPTEADRNNDALWTFVGSTVDYSTKYYGLSGLAANSTQYYRVSYSYATGEPEKSDNANDWLFPQTKKYSQIVEVKTLSDIKVSSTGTNSIRLEWDSQTLTGGSKYTVQVRIAGSGAWSSPYADTTNTNFVCDNLEADTEYEFRVVFNGNKETATLKAKTGKYIPSVVSREIGINSASATVQMKCGSTDSGFQLQYRLKTPQDSNAWVPAGATASVSGGTVTMTATGLIPEAEYEFRIVYTSNSVQVESEVVAVPIADALIFDDVTGNTVTISWLDKSFPDRRDGTDYYVEWREAGSTGVWSVGTATDANSYKVTKLEPNKEYEFRLRYSTLGGVSAYSALKTIKTTQPTIKATTPQVGSVKLSWEFDSYGGNGFVIQYKVGNQWYEASTVTGDKTHETTLTKIKNTSGVFVDLDPETEYTFRIAYKTSQSGSDYVYSEEIKVTTLGGMQVVENSATTTSITVKWDFVTDAAYYTIQYRETGTSNWIKSITDIPASQKQYEIKDLDPGVEYEIQLVYSDGTPKDATITAKTTVAAPAAPSGLVAADITKDGCTIKWFDNTAFEEDYILEVVNNVTGVVVFKGGIGAKIGSSDPKDEKTKATYELTGLDTNISYTAKLYAKNAEGSSALATVTFKTLDVARPNAVNSPKAATTPTTITLSWKIKSITDMPDPTQFRIEYEYTDPDTKVKTWYEVTGLTTPIPYNTDTETYSVTISDKIDFGDGRSVDIEVKKTYSFRIVALGFTSGGVTYGDSPASTTVKATTKAITVPSGLSATEIKLTSAKVKFTDGDTNVPYADKSYTVYYVEGKYTDLSKVPADAVFTPVSVTNNGTKSQNVVLEGLKAGTTYTYYVEWEFADAAKVVSKPANFTTKALPKPTTIKTGYTLTTDGKFACQISWKPPASTNSVPIPADTVITYFIEVSLNGKAGTFTLLADSITPSTSGKGLKYTSIAFDALAKKLPAGTDITTCKSLSIRIGAVYTQGATEIGTAYSTNGKISLPKFQ